MTECIDNQDNKTQLSKPNEIIYHRNDFKNKFYLIKFLLILKIAFNVIIIYDNIRQSRMLCLDRYFLLNLKQILEDKHISKQDFSKVLIY